jgi:hypothetical protein
VATPGFFIFKEKIHEVHQGDSPHAIRVFGRACAKCGDHADA